LEFEPVSLKIRNDRLRQFGRVEYKGDGDQT